MNFFGWISNEHRIPQAVDEAAGAIKPQLIEARVKYSSDKNFEIYLVSGGTVLFIHGFVNYFARKHGLRRHSVWAANVLAFEKSFGHELGTRMILQVQKELATSDAAQWMMEGSDAARYFERDQIALLAAFLEGAAK